MFNAVLFNSDNRFDSFLTKIKNYDINCTVLDFTKPDWIDFNYDNIDILIYYPTFKFTSNHPLALNEVHDNLVFLNKQYPHIAMFPDPPTIHYYNDKYRQFLFLQKNNFPIPPTLPLYSEETVELASKELGFPMVIKNRHGASGEYGYKIKDKSELMKYFRFSRLNFWSFDALSHVAQKMSKREFYYFLVKEKELEYPLFSYPLIAQKFIKMERDLKTVVGDFKVVESHWRIQANEKMWKVNIDGGGIGEWSYVPQEAIDISEKLANDLKTRWLNIDLVVSEGKFLITEFSPVWHHYKYKEKPSFVYKDDYNIDMPLEESLDLEKIIIESLIKAARQPQKTA